MWLRDERGRFLVRVSGRARVDAVKNWTPGDRLMAIGHLESHYDTRCGRHTVIVRGVTVSPLGADGDDQWWEKIGLPLVLVNLYHQMGGSDTRFVRLGSPTNGDGI